MEIKIKNNNEYIPATLEVVDGVMIVSPVKGNDITQFKDGDIITCGWNDDGESYSWICILRGEIEQIADNMFIASYCDIDCNGEYSCQNGDSDSATWVRYATEEEKQKLFDVLAKEGKAWDEEQKKVVDLKWKPKDGETYFAPVFTYTDTFYTKLYVWEDVSWDTNLYNKGWCFKTKEECEAYCKRLDEAIERVKP